MSLLAFHMRINDFTQTSLMNLMHTKNGIMAFFTLAGIYPMLVL